VSGRKTLRVATPVKKMTNGFPRKKMFARKFPMRKRETGRA